MSHIEKSVYVDKALSFAQGLAFRYRHEFITPEHILSALFNQDPFVEAVEECFCHIPVMEEEVDEYLAQKWNKCRKTLTTSCSSRHSRTCCSKMHTPS